MIILAAGQGKRMRSRLPKVAHEVAGRPLVNWVIDAATTLQPESLVVVVGHGAEEVGAILPPGTRTALQAEQHGTGHATKVALAELGDLDPDDVVVILYGDTPLITSDLVRSLAAFEEGEALRMVTAEVDDPSGYGRVVRDPHGSVIAVVEDRDADEAQKAIREINAGFYSVRAGLLAESLGQISPHNDQGEYYLTDVVGILAAAGHRLTAVRAAPEEVAGINSQDQLAEAQAAKRREINQRLMESGVWMLDPDRVYIDATVTVEPGARIYPDTYLRGDTRVAAGAEVGPDVWAEDSTIGANSRVWYAVLRSSVVGEECQVGPFASLRPGTVMERGSKIGTFVETKNTTLGEGAKAPHLSYLGDATVGSRANIGAGTITCNYDGISKYPTVIGEGAFIGSDTMLVAPVTIGDGAITGAGSVITRDVSPGALAVERSDQVEIPGYAERRRSRKSASDPEG
ncbi:MAG: bifunctional UDP-N-acetylglucosamine diphosphorylase/glucosamine-1-phosphate N-acetyltransferase GlmU [Actinomycetes bacterium]